MIPVDRLRFVAFLGSHRCDQAIAFLGNGLDEGWVLGVITQRFAYLPDGIGQNLFGYKFSVPDFVKEIRLRYNAAGTIGKAGQYLHRFRLELDFVFGSYEPIQMGLSDPLTNLKVVFQDSPSWFRQ